MAKSLPDKFPPAEKSFSLYEDIEYQEYWEEPGLDRLDALEQHLITELLPASGRSIIDLGCGYGRLAPCYVDRFERVVLCDGSLSLLHGARETLGDRAVLVAADVTRLPFKPASFDAVLTIRVLQHIQNLECAFEEAHRILARDGTFVFSYHNKSNPHRVLRYLADRSSGNPFTLESVPVWATLISHHPRRVGALMREAGFSDPEYCGTVVVNALANITDRLGRKSPSGASWAQLMGRLRIAPWLIGQSFSQGGSELAPGDDASEILACPACHGDLSRSDRGFGCSACTRMYPIEDGIFDFRV
ncbi:MAG: hypothetical protein CVT67_08900 [Actinobacteria bacterium HGW-Actinobacteria-7]|nr:MAG: hypothetical protein CVT67_08900 [Actinobacteria bacterium HGW-Actinobacteria-7]